MKSNLRSNLLKGVLGLGLASVVASSNASAANPLSRLRFSVDYGAADERAGFNYQSFSIRFDESDNSEIYGKFFTRRDNASGYEEDPRPWLYHWLAASPDQPQYWGEPLDPSTWVAFKERDLAVVVGKEKIHIPQEYSWLHLSSFMGAGVGLAQGRLLAQSTYNKEDWNGRAFNKWGPAFEVGASIGTDYLGVGFSINGILTGYGKEQDKVKIAGYLKAGLLK